jgi:response regulator RpfG family c-di-GMP phosphodiesterase
MTSNKPQKPHLEHWIFQSELEMSRVHTRLVDQLNQAFSDIKRGLRPKQLIENVIEMILKSLETNPWTLLRYIHDNQPPVYGVASNSVNCALFGGVIYPYVKEQVGSLYLFTRAIILHDIGMLFLPNHILTKMGKLDDKERASLETHPGMGYERLKEWGEPTEVLETAIEHHEEWNGKGYPRGISQEEIHPIARILAPILYLNALLTERPYRGSLVGYWSMKQILKETGTRFSPQSVKTIMNVLGLFPPGSLVLLTDGSVCRVMETVYAQPLRPKVRLLIDAGGHPFLNETGPIIDLSTAKKLFIAKAISSQDIREQE